MQTRWKKICLVIAAGAALMLGGCGKDGKDGAPGKDAGVVVKVADLTAETIKTLSLSGTVTKVSIPDSGKPEVFFTITDASGRGVTGLTGYLSRFTIATLVPGTNGAPDEWLNYLQRKSTNAANGWPTSDAGGKLTDNGDGSYRYVFDTSIKKEVPHNKTTFHPVEVAYVPTQTHRIGFTIDGQPAGAVARITTLPFIYDFVPAGGTPNVAREVTSTAACNTCHDDLTTVLTKSGGTHSRGRGDVRFCVMCHTKQGGALEANTASVNGAFDATKQIQVADGEILGYFPNMIHKFHMGTKLAKTGYNFWGAKFNEIKYPQDIRNCETCHSGEKAPQAANWKTKPSRQACGSCHDGINWATGAGHVGGSASSDQACVLCHKAVDITAYHPAKLPATADATKRTMQTTITSVKIDDVTGRVTAYFTVTNNDQPVTSQAGFIDTTSGGGPYPQFTLTKLVTGADGATKWVSYTNRFRTKTTGMAPVLQASSDTAGTYADVDPAKGQYSYTFELNNSSVPGNIKAPLVEANVDPRSLTVGYNGAMRLPLPADYAANFTAFDATKTHRVTMALSGAKMKKAAYLDFVPNGAKVTQTRNIVTMAACNACHNGKALHRGYDIELCVGCHTQDTKDSMTGQSVDLQTFVHKLHMGKNLPSVKAGGEYRINSAAGGAHDYTNLGYPGIISNCRVCHVEGTGAPANAANWRTTPTANACITCHDGAASTAHAAQNANSCMTCHGNGRAAAADVAHQ